MDLKIICAQVNPIHSDHVQSMQNTRKMLEGVQNADILVLPEMTFTGYTFNDLVEITPFLEEPNQNYPTFHWCSQKAQRLGAYVFCGYPEKSCGKFYNSMMILSPEGTLLENYRKNFLYYIDKSWAIEGEGQKTVEIVIRSRVFKVGLGICMDICPYEFTAPFNKFELANYWKVQNVDLCVFCTNWTVSAEHDSSENLIKYWISRLFPLIENDKSTYFIAADRVGIERGKEYLGTSCIMRLGQGCEVLIALNKVSEDILEYILHL